VFNQDQCIELTAFEKFRIKTYWGLKVKTRLYEALVLSTLLNSAELWPVSVTQMKKKLEAAHHRWQRSILGISWKDKVTDEKVREATALPKLEDIIRRRRLRWLGHLSRMDDGSP